MLVFVELQRQAARVASAVLAVALGGGCISGSLASSTGPRPGGYRWSDAPKQMAHVAETVEFDFVLQDLSHNFVHPLATADYCVLFIGQDRLETEPGLSGHFEFSYTLSPFEPGEVIEIQAEAYRERGGRDFMMIGGRWMRTDSPIDEPDQRVAVDSIEMTIYVAPIELTLARPADDLDLESGVLRIRRDDGSIRSVYIDRPIRSGFTITGPEPDGYYRVRYLPGGNELNPTGTTEVEFVIHDLAGNRHEKFLTLQTP